MPQVDTDILEVFESRLLAVERAASLDLPVGDVFAMTLRALETVIREPRASLWLFTRGVPECVISNAGTTAAPTLPSAFRLDTGELTVVTEAIASETSSESSGSPPAQNRPGVSIWATRCFDDVAGSFAVCLDVRTMTDPRDGRLTEEAVRTLTECLSIWFRRNLISRMDEKLLTQHSVLNFCHQAYSRTAAPDFGFLAASELRLLLKCDRVTLFRVSSGSGSPRSELAGISGCEKPDMALAVPTALRVLGEYVARKFTPDQEQTWNSPDILFETTDHRVQESLTELKNGGTRTMRLILVPPVPRFGPAGQPVHTQPPASGFGDPSQSSPPNWIVLAELFEQSKPPGEAHWNACQEQVVRILQHAGPGSRIQRSILQRFRLLAVSLLIASGLVGAGLIPVRFEVDATGRMVPAEERRYFAPGSGTVQDLAIHHEARVLSGQTLLKIHSPELVLKQQEVLGQLETERVRLSSLQRSRLTSDLTTAREGLELALGGEQTIRQRIADLEVRLKLLRAQQQHLEIVADVPGRVYRRNMEHDLQARPVQPGDFLFELIADGSSWRLELEISEDLLQYLPVTGIRPGHMVSPTESSKSVQIPVRYRFVADPRHTHNASITEFQESVIRKNGRPDCIAIATLDDDPEQISEKFRQPGVTVSARIDCGHRPAAFVLFREFVEFFREKMFHWS